MDKLKEFGGLALGSRMKRLSDVLMRDVKIIYKRLEVDFEPVHMPVFRTVYEEKKATISELTNCLKISQPAVTQFVNALIKKGLATSRLDPDDRRKKNVSLTNKGQAMMSNLEPIWHVLHMEIQKVLDFENKYFIEQLGAIENQLSETNFYNKVMKAITEHVKIMPFVETEINYFANLNLEWLEKYFFVEEHDIEVLHNPKSYIIDKGGAIFYAYFGTQVVGTAAIMKEKEGHELSKMAVLPAFQGLKIGQKLIDKCINYAKENLINELLLYSSKKLTPAINMYKKNGFVEVPLPEDNPYIRSDIKMIKKIKL